MMSLKRDACTCYQPQIKDHKLKEYNVPISALPPGLLKRTTLRVILKIVCFSYNQWQQCIEWIEYTRHRYIH